MPHAVKWGCPGPRQACHHSANRTQEFYGITLEALAEAKNERLWFKTQLKLCSLWLKLHEYSRATKLLKELHRHGARCCGPVLVGGQVWRLHAFAALRRHLPACACRRGFRQRRS